MTLNEPVVEVGKAEEATNMFNTFCDFLSNHGLNLLQEHFKSFIWNQITLQIDKRDINDKFFIVHNGTVLNKPSNNLLKGAIQV